MTEIGTSPPRPDGFAKVSGAAVYGDDLAVEGLVYGATLRSPHAHARIRRLRWRPELAPEGAVCVTAADLPGPNGVQLLDDSWPILASDVVRHVGEPVALVSGRTRRDARKALAAVEVDYEPLSATLDPRQAADEPLLAELLQTRGDVETAFAGAFKVLEGSYTTGHQEHVYIECQSMTAWFEPDGRLVVHGSMQCPYYVHASLVHAFGLPGDRVRVRASAVGGGFGGKEDFPSALAIHAALLARATGRPIRIAYDRHEDIVGTTKRHPSVVRHRTAVDGEGRLLAMDVDVLLDGGAYLTLSPVVLSRAVLHATGPYRCPNVRVRGRVVRTHTATNGAFRGFGAPQVAFAIERQMDKVGRALGLDPLEIRLRNVVEAGDELPSGQVLDGTTAARECLESVALVTDFRRRWREAEASRRGGDGTVSTGVGLSLYFHGCGFTGNGERKMRSPVTVRLAPDGRVELLTSMVDMGQGCSTVFPQIACSAGGLADSDVLLADPDTARVPDSGPTVASRATMVVGGTLHRAVRDLVARILAWWNERYGAGSVSGFEAGRAVGPGAGGESFRDVARSYLREVGPLEITRRHEPPVDQQFDDEAYRGAAYASYSWGADVVEVEVDRDTLEIAPRRVTAVCEVGRVLHPTQCRGQMEGGILQSLGWGLLEEMKLSEGRYLNDRLATYIIPTFRDAPPIEVRFLEAPVEGDDLGAKGVGELPMDGGAPAVAAAVENATGVFVGDLPVTPERLSVAGWREHRPPDGSGHG